MWSLMESSILAEFLFTPFLFSAKQTDPIYITERQAIIDMKYTG